METILEPGKFYQNINLGFFYICISTEGESITMMLLDSEQHGKRISFEFTIDIEQASQYQLVNDEKEISRLERVFEKFMKAS
jgi:hypothetical protein